VQVAAVEHPVLAADDDLPRGSLAARGVERDPTVEEDGSQLVLLVDGVAERLGREVPAGRSAGHAVNPLVERVDHGYDARLSRLLSIHGRQASERVVGHVDRSNTREPLDADLVLADRRLEEVAAQVRPAADQHHATVVGVLGPATVEDVVDAAGVGLQEPAEPVEQLRHGVLRVLLGAGEEYLVAVRDDGEEYRGRRSSSFLAR
jgi:hypothetical protein